MFTSMICAPFSTCWRATASASSYCSARMSRANALEPLTLVRSPTFTNSEFSSILKGSSPDRRSGGMGGFGVSAEAAEADMGFTENRKTQP